MLRVIVEIVPFGNERDSRTLAVMEIGNVGGDSELGDYTVRFVDERGPRQAKVSGHLRARGYWPLIARAARAHVRAKP